MPSGSRVMNSQLINNSSHKTINSRILLVEDEVIIALYIQSVLNKYGYEKTDIVSNADDCLRLLMENDYDLIIMDISIEGDRDGVETAFIINSKYDIPLIFLTAYSDSDMLEKAKRANPYGYIIKPINAKELYAMVEMSIYKHHVDNELKDRELKFRTLFEQSRDGIVLCDRQGIILDVNDSACDLFDAPAGELTGISVGSTFSDEDEVGVIFQSLLERGYINDYEARMKRRDGSTVDCSVTVTVLKNDKNDITGYQGIFRDISERKLVEKKIMDSVDKERQRIGRDLHDGLGQILTGTGFLCELLIKKLAEKDLPEAENAEEIFTLLNEAKEQTRSIARGLSPINIGEEGGFNVSLEQLCINYEKLFNISCQLDYRDQFVPRDDLQALNLYYIIMEAANNAVRHGRASRIVIEIKKKDERFHFLIKDNGIGIKDKNLTTERGLGIHTMRYRAGIIGATIDIDSSNGQGASVACILKD